MKPKTIFIGVIPGIFGYGISVASDTREGAMDAMHEAYDDWKKVRPNPDTNFETSFEEWGGRIEEVVLGKTYYDDFGS